MRFIFALLFLASFAHADDQTLLMIGPTSWVSYENGGNHTLTSSVLNANDDEVGYVFVATRDDTITQCCYRATKTGSPTTVRVGIQALNTSGDPDGSYIQSVDATPGATGEACYTFTGVSISRGIGYSCVVLPQAGFDGSNYLTVWSHVGNSRPQGHGYAYNALNGGAKSRQSAWPIFSLKSASYVYGFPQNSNCSNDGTCSFSDERGLEFVLPTSLCSTAKLLGISFPGTFNGGQTIDLNLYAGGAAGDTTPIESITIDADIYPVPSSRFPKHLFFDGTTLSTITCGSRYRVSMDPSSSITMEDFNVIAAADWEAYMTGLSNWNYTTRAGGNWTDTATRMPLITLILSDVTAPSGGGGATGSKLNKGFN